MSRKWHRLFTKGKIAPSTLSNLNKTLDCPLFYLILLVIYLGFSACITQNYLAFTPGVTPPLPEKSIMINLDFSYKVFACNIHVTDLKDIPNEVSHTERFVKLLDYVDEHSVCPGIVCNEKLEQLAMSGGRNGIFKDKKGKIRGKLNESSTCVRPVDCFGIVQNSNSICKSCQVFRKSLLTMLSNQNAKKQSQSATSANSHCPWKYLSTEESSSLCHAV